MFEYLIPFVVCGVVVYFFLKNNKAYQEKFTKALDENNDGKLDKEDAKVVVNNIVAEEKRVEEKVKKVVKRVRKPKV